MKFSVLYFTLHPCMIEVQNFAELFVYLFINVLQHMSILKPLTGSVYKCTNITIQIKI